jgi:carbamoyltransferase
VLRKSGPEDEGSMRILGIGTGGDSGAALVEDGRILAAVNEERISRMKLVEGFPRASIRDVMAQASCAATDLDRVMVAATSDLLKDELEAFEGWFQHHPSGAMGMIKRMAGKLSHLRDSIPLLEKGYYALLEPGFARRRKRVEQILREEFEIRCPIQFVDHHLCHVTSAYFTSGFDDALVMSVDGGGDGRSSLVYAVRGGQWQQLHDVSAYDSLGNYYAYVTHICGFKAMKHEGKITGLAAYGEPIYLELLRRFVDERAGSFQNLGRRVFREAIGAIEKELPKGWRREDLAASVQVHFEQVMQRYVAHWARKSGMRDLALAGGVVANVRINEEIHELPEVGRMFIHPHMGDGGLPAGAALAACVPGVAPQTMARDPEPLRDVYLGKALEEREVLATLRQAGLSPETLSTSLEEAVADLLVQGYVVARAAGRMEYGPRALGNRSILYQPTDRSVNDWLNVNLRRTEFMPFAPSALHEERARMFVKLEGAEHAAEFMTTTFHCTPWMCEHMKGVVHLDDTARPHLVRRDRNPSYHRIIEAFARQTGLPAVINTSFNMHEEPIVYSADDCVRAFLDGNLDYLAIDRFLVKHPRGLTHDLKKVTPVR